MSHEVNQAIYDLAYQQRRAEQAEAIARTLQAQRDAAEATRDVLRQALDKIDRHVVGAYVTYASGDADAEPCEECGDMRDIAAQALAALKASTI